MQTSAVDPESSCCAVAGGNASLTDEQVEAIGADLDAIRAEMVGSPGERDARYIHRVIASGDLSQSFRRTTTR